MYIKISRATTEGRKEGTEGQRRGGGREPLASKATSGKQK